MAEFQVSGHTYRSGKMDAFTQFHVTRRLAPVLSSFRDITDVASLGQGNNPSTMLSALAPLMDAVAKMPDDHVNYVLSSCLSVCQRVQANGAGASPVWSQAAMRPMFDDMDMVAMLQIVSSVLTQELSGFFSALPSKSSTEEAA